MNDRLIDEYPHITQSETSVGVAGDTVLVGFNDSRGWFREGDFMGYARSVDAGETRIDMGGTADPV